MPQIWSVICMASPNFGSKSSRIFIRTFTWIPGAAWVPKKTAHVVDLKSQFNNLKQLAVRENQSQLEEIFKKELCLHHPTLEIGSKSAWTRKALHGLLAKAVSEPDTFETKRKRMSIPRSQLCPFGIYNAFLRHLYASEGHFDFEKVLNVVREMPKPSASFIHPQHLEDFIAASLSHSFHNSKPEEFEKVVTELEMAQLPLTVNEQARYLFALASRSSARDHTVNQIIRAKFNSWRKDFESAATPTLNMLLAAGFKARIKEISRFVDGRMVLPGHTPDRMTFITRMKYSAANSDEAKRRFNEFYHNGFHMSIEVLNTVIRSFLKNGHGDSARSMLRRLLDSNPTCRPGELTFSDKASINSTQLQMDFIHRRCFPGTPAPEIFPMIPGKNLFQVFIYHYLRDLDFESLMVILIEMADRHIFPDRGTIYNILGCFRKSKSINTIRSWGSPELNKFTSYILDISQSSPGLLSDSLCENISNLHEQMNPQVDIQTLNEHFLASRALC